MARGPSKFDRLVHLLNLLRSRRQLTAPRLVEELGVHVRSIYRYVQSLSEMGVPVYYDRGYKVATDAFLPPLNFTADEYNVLRLLLSASVVARHPTYRDLAGQITAKIDAAASEQATGSAPTTYLDSPTSYRPETVSRWYRDLEHATAEQLVVTLDYESISTGQTTREVEPHFIVFRGRSFYLVAYCRWREDFRTFRIDRVRGLSITERMFQRRSGVSPETYFEGAWGVATGQSVEVVVRFTGIAARIVRLGHYHERQQIEDEGDGAIRYSVTVNGTTEITRWIMGFGPEAEVIAPEDLRQAVRSSVVAMAARYVD